MRHIFFLIIFFLAVGCKKDVLSEQDTAAKLTANISETESEVQLHTAAQPSRIAKDRLPLKRVVLLNASLYGYINELGVSSSVVGVTSPQYFFDPKISAGIQKGSISNVGNDQKYDVEKIIALQPDAVVTNYTPNFETTYEAIRSHGVPVLFIDEYRAVSPLEKAQLITVFGRLYNLKDAADKQLGEITAAYQALSKRMRRHNNKPKVLLNEMYGNIWYMPGGQSAAATLVHDAGGDYIFKDLAGKEAHHLTFEQVLIKSKDADVWMNAGNYPNKQTLLTMNSNYQKLQVYQKGRIYGLYSGQRGMSNDMFESGNVRADLVLLDYAGALHPELFPGHRFRYVNAY